MTWPFENDTDAIIGKLARKSLKSEKRRNLMVVIAVMLAASLICFTGIVSVSLAQMQRNQVVDTYEAVYTGIDENDVETLKGLPEFARIGEYYMLGQERSVQGYQASYVYCDSEMMYMARSQMELVKGRLPEQANEVAVSQFFLSAYGSDAQIGETVLLDTESFYGEYIVTGIIDAIGEKEADTYAVVVSKAALTEWAGFDPAGYRAYVHFKEDRQPDQEAITSLCQEIAEKYGLPPAGINDRYFVYYSKSIDFAMVFGVAALVMIGGYVVIQSIFRISVNDKIQSYGQLRTIGATPKQLRRIVKKESRQLAGIGILGGVLLGVWGGAVLFPKGFHALYYAAVALLTVFICWFMVMFSVRRPVKTAAGISPLQALRFLPEQKKIHSRKKNMKLNPVSMGFANFRRDREKTASIVASLSLGGILLLIVSSVFLTRSPEQYARLRFPDGDYKVYLHSDQSEEEIMAAGNPLDEELKQEILSVDGVTEVLAVRQAIHVDFRTSAHTSAGMCDMLTDANYSQVESALISGVMPADMHSVVLDSSNHRHYDDMDVGDTLELCLGDRIITVTISGIFDSKKVISGHGSLALDGAVLFAAEELFRDSFPEIESFDYSWSIISDSGKAQDVKAGLENIVAGHSNIALDEIDTMINFQKAQDAMILGGIQALSWLFFLFGVVNLVNTTLSNQMSRKRENSILRSVGLTGKQLCQMNISEGFCYAFFAALAALGMGTPISAAVCREISKITFGGEVVPYRFPVLEMGLFILVLFGMEVILSAWTIRRQKKQSLIDLMRAVE